MNPNDVDQITDADALLPNGCELISYIDDGSSTGRTKCAVIVRNGGNSSPNGAEPLLGSAQGKSLTILNRVLLYSFYQNPAEWQ